jgi:hypothetical protein
VECADDLVKARASAHFLSAAHARQNCPAVFRRTFFGSSGPATVVDPDSVYGNNTATWNPKIVVSMPANALADNYSATITTSIL